MFLYFKELKSRSYLILLFFLCNFLILFFYKDFLLIKLLKLNAFCFNNFYYFTVTNASEIFYSQTYIVLYCSSQNLFLYTIFQLYSFILPALFKYERFFVKKMLKASFLAFLFSSYISFYYAIPLIGSFFLSYQNATQNIYFEAKLMEYVCFVLNILFYFVLYFQLTTLLYLLFYVRLKKIRKYRKIQYYILILFATLISPPEISYQLLLIVIFILLFESFVAFSFLKHTVIKSFKITN